MLVLSRKVGEVIVVDGNLRIVFLGMDKGQLKLGFDCEEGIHDILREELIGAAPRVPVGGNR